MSVIELHGKFYALKGAFEKKIIVFDHCIKILIDRKFRKVLLVLMHFDIYAHFPR